MDSPVKKALQSAVSKILEPLATLFLKHGEAYGAFEQLARNAFVKAGFPHMEESGKRPTISGIAALTGLSRKAVAHYQRPELEGQNQSRLRYSRAVRVISGWVNDPLYHLSGVPAVLSIDGPNSRFSELVRHYSGDVSPGALLAMLQQSGNIQVENGSAELVTRAYVPMDTEPDTLNILGVDVAELIHTVSHNVSAEPGNRLFQRKVSAATLNRDDLEAFRVFSNERSQQLLEEYDAWLTRHDISVHSKSQEDAVYVAVGIYYTEGLNQEKP